MTVKGWDWQQRSDDFCTTIRVRIPKSVGGHNSIWIHKGILSAAYSILQESHIPLTRWEWLIWKIQIGIPTKWESQKPNNQLRPGILTNRIKYMVSLSGKAIVRQPHVSPVTRCKYLRYDTAITPYTIILLTTKGSWIFGTYLMLEPNK